MRFQTVKDILHHTAELHGRLADILASASEAHQKNGLGQLLQYLADHEQQLRNSLKNYTSDGADHLLKTWFDYAPDPALPSIPDNLEILMEAKDADAVVEPIIEFHNKMIDIYKQLRDQANNTTVKDFFEGLADLEQAEKIQLAGDAKHFNDL